MQINDTARRRAPKQPLVTLTCCVCSVSFEKWASRANLYTRHFCGSVCRNSVGTRVRVNPEIRFWERVDKNGPVSMLRPEYGPCWPRSGANRRGYSVFNDGIRKATFATHYAWSLSSGESLPSGIAIGHVCDNPPCIRNDDVGTYEVDGVLYERRGHLWLAGGSLANSRDMKVKGRASRSGSALFPLVGQEHPRAKLKDADIRTILSLHATGAKGIDIAQIVDVSPTTISRVIRRKTWKHVE